AELYQIDLFLVLLYEGLGRNGASSCRRWLQSPRAAIRAYLRPGRVIRLLQRDLEDAMAHLQRTAEGFEVQLADTIRLTRLPKRDAFQFFRHLVNYTASTRTAGSLQYDTHVDYFMADSS